MNEREIVHQYPDNAVGRLPRSVSVPDASETGISGGLRISGEREWFRSLMRTAPNTILFLSPTCRILELNPEAERLHNCRGDEVIGKSYLELFVPRTSRNIFISVIKTVLGGRPAKGFCAPIVTTRDQERFLSWNIHRVLDSKKKPRGVVAMGRDITEQKKVMAALVDAEQRLAGQARALAETNTALRVLVKQRENDRFEVEENILANVRELLLPYIEKLKKRRIPENDLACLHLLEANMHKICSPFSKKLTSAHIDLTPKEIQIASLIREGRQDKDIIEVLNISPTTVKSHRQNIRKKLGIYNQKINLKTILASL